MGLYFLVFMVAFGVTFGITPFFKKIALGIGAMDHPDARKVHVQPIPRLGGGGVVTGFFAAVAAFFWVGPWESIDAHLTTGVLIGGALIVAVGLMDDLFNLPAKWKFAGQILAASLAYWFGAQILFLNNPINGVIWLGILAYPLTIFWIVGITNAVNLMDGLDGLAAGVTAIAGTTLFIVGLHLHQIEAAILSLALVGASLGFLRYNFFPASIFLGDTGSLFLGYLLAVIAVTGVLKSTLLLALIVPLLILGVPIFDTTLAILRRVLSRQPIFRPDKQHVHHQLLGAGLHQRQVVLLIYLATFFLCLGALAITLHN